MPREVFDRELDELRTEVLTIASEVEENLMRVTNALLNKNETVAKHLIETDKDINRYE